MKKRFLAAWVVISLSSLYQLTRINSLDSFSIKSHAKKNKLEPMSFNETQTKINVSSTENEKKSDGKEQNQFKIESQLYFVLHIGPPKTGTTTIQCKLNSLRRKEQLPKNVTLIPKRWHEDMCNGEPKLKLKKKEMDTRKFVRCLQKWKRKKPPTCWETQLLPYLEEQSEQQNSIILSEETFSFLLKRSTDAMYQEFLSYLSELNYRTIVIFGYRRYFDLVFSGYGQKYGMYTKQFSYFLNHNFTFQEYMTPETQFSKYYELVNFYNSSNNDFRILNMDEISIVDLETQFFCLALPIEFSTIACDESSSSGVNEKKEKLMDKKKIIKKNTANDFFWCNMLARYVFQQRIGITLKLGNVKRLTNSIESFLKKNSQTCFDLPSTCPDSGFYERIRSEADKYHDFIFKNATLLESKREEYNEKFQKLKPKFCSVDFVNLFKNETWNNFFDDYFNNQNVRTRS